MPYFLPLPVRRKESTFDDFINLQNKYQKQ